MFTARLEQQFRLQTASLEVGHPFFVKGNVGNFAHFIGCAEPLSNLPGGAKLQEMRERHALF
jgi:hypothetical protein